MKRIYRSETDKVVAGICGGLGEVYGFDPVIARIILIFLAIFTGFIPIFILYLIAWIIIPPKSKILS